MSPFILTIEYLDQLKQLVYQNATINISISAQDIPVLRCSVTVSAVPGTSIDEIASTHVKLLKLSNSLKIPSEIIVVVSPFRFTEFANQQLYATDSPRIQTTRYGIEGK